MSRDQYKLFSQGRIGPLVLSNRLVRSATFDPSILEGRKMTTEVLNIYRTLAEGGVGLIITGDTPVIPEHMLDDRGQVLKDFTFDDVRIEGLDRLVDVVRSASPQCKLIAQISGAWTGVRPSDVPTAFDHGKMQILTAREIEMIIGGLAEGIVQMKALGFDGVQLHCAHGYLLSRFLSPYSNRREDQYGGSVVNRVRIIREVVAEARGRAGDFPILIKMNGTDNMPGGIDAQNLPALALEIEKAGIDAIEISGGMADCLIRPESELGFPPVPIPEAHTRINHPDKESYFLEHAEKLSLGIPIILVGGNRDVERLEAIVRRDKVDFIALCRPLINEPDLPRRWLEGRGTSATEYS
jgi:2,4-dienoyl-CoA reductase-like NADH-dependent reductase (Old Yellow Enzyme family)